jgi:protein-tyrosine phosphatase
VAAGSAGVAELEFDNSYDKKIPVNFRQNEDRKMSGSATFSEKGAKYIVTRSPVVTVFDLRQEPHGLINGIPVTWSSEKDWANAGLNNEESLRREKRFLASLRIGEKINKTPGQKIKIKSVETEESLIRSLSQIYVRLTVTEHIRPSDDEVDRFIDAVHDLPLDSWAHFHDRTGKGRSTVFMAMYDMLRNSQNTEFDAIMKRNIDLSKDNILLVSPESDWRNPYQQDLVAFLKEFYNYAKAHPNGDDVFWSQWLKR